MEQRAHASVLEDLHVLHQGVALHADQEVPVLARANEFQHGHVAGESAVEDCEAVVRDERPQLFDESLLANRPWAATHPREEPIREVHESNEPQLRISRIPFSATAAGLAEVLKVRIRVLDPKVSAISAIEREAAIAAEPRRIAPSARDPVEEPAERLGPDSIPCLRERTRSESVGPKDEAEMVHHIPDGAVGEQRHPEHEPNGLLGWEFSPTNRRGAGRFERLADPSRLEGCGKSVEPSFGSKFLRSVQRFSKPSQDRGSMISAEPHGKGLCGDS
ncbi:MAG: hypothetical protein FD118_4165 [Rhodocyclaceae bacterium]|nr:MAG: hypothetical protein FD118_4165 [Rhodocyclaceae bacterium]